MQISLAIVLIRTTSLSSRQIQHQVIDSKCWNSSKSIHKVVQRKRNKRVHRTDVNSMYVELFPLLPIPSLFLSPLWMKIWNTRWGGQCEDVGKLPPNFEKLRKPRNTKMFKYLSRTREKLIIAITWFQISFFKTHFRAKPSGAVECSRYWRSSSISLWSIIVYDDRLFPFSHFFHIRDRHCWIKFDRFWHNSPADREFPISNSILLQVHVRQSRRNQNRIKISPSSRSLQPG